MRKLIAQITILAAIMLLTLTACKKPCPHKNVDENGECTKCGEYLGTGCTEHTDADENGKCDKCGADVNTECTEHADTDEDGKCDKCGTDVDTECTEHTDSDGDGKCDECGADVESDDGGSGSIPGVTPPGDFDLPPDRFN